MNHTCINTQMTADGSVPPPCAACALNATHATEQAYTRADVEAAWDQGYARGKGDGFHDGKGWARRIGDQNPYRKPPPAEPKGPK